MRRWWEIVWVGGGGYCLLRNSQQHTCSPRKLCYGFPSNPVKQYHSSNDQLIIKLVPHHPCWWPRSYFSIQLHNTRYLLCIYVWSGLDSSTYIPQYISTHIHVEAPPGCRPTSEFLPKLQHTPWMAAGGTQAIARKKNYKIWLLHTMINTLKYQLS